MRNLMLCRRTFVSTMALLCLTFLGAYKGMDVAYAIAIVSGALAGSNAAENAMKAKAGA